MNPGHLLGYLILGATAAGGLIWGIVQKREDSTDKIAFLQSKVKMLEDEISDLESEAPPEVAAPPTSPAPTPDEIAQRAEAYRELTFKEKPVFIAVPRQDFEAALEEDVRRSLPDDGGENLLAALAQIGFVFDPDGEFEFDMIESITGLRLTQENALYDPAANTITYPEDTELRDAGERSRLTAACVTALQHQHFGEITVENADAAHALAALRTGEIGQITLRISLLEPDEVGAPPPSPEATQPYYGAPVYLRETNLFPHVFGTRFVGELHSKNGWETVNAAYARIPSSSAEVMHPKNYPSSPTAITLDTSPLAGETALATDVAGELGINLLLQTLTAPRTSASAAIGWAGDRWLSYPSGYLWDTRWKDENEAAEFQEQIETYLKRRYVDIDIFPQVTREQTRVTLRVADTEAFAQALDTRLK